MTTRTQCQFKGLPLPFIQVPICSICEGLITVNGKLECPFLRTNQPIPQYQHLITADERYYSVQRMAGLNLKREKLKQLLEEI